MQTLSVCWYPFRYGFSFVQLDVMPGCAPVSRRKANHIDRRQIIKENQQCRIYTETGIPFFWTSQHPSRHRRPQLILKATGVQAATVHLLSKKRSASVTYLGIYYIKRGGMILSRTSSFSEPFPEDILQEIRGYPGNDHCCDCPSLDTDWCSISHGTLICLECAGKHRSLGVLVSFVRSISMDSWSPQQVRNLAELIVDDQLTSLYLLL